MSLAPVIVFAYNRPDLLDKTLDFLSKNELAEQSELFIYCDGAKQGADQEQINRINDTRQVARGWSLKRVFKDIHITEREANLGLGTSIITGVSAVIKEFGKCIVLEDDLQTSPLFLDYMNKCLCYYETRKSVFSISGLSRPHPERFFPKDYPYDVYVSLTHHPTGWATWQDRWEQVDWTAQHYYTLLEDKYMQSAFKRAGNEMWDQLLLCKQSGRNIWSVLFYLAHFENHAVSICPIVSYIEHIGWGPDSTNCPGDGAAWKHEKLAEKKEIRFLDVLYEDSRIINSWYSFRFGKPRNFIGKVINAYGRRFRNKDEFFLKGKVYDA
jgi:hypothetical protein